MAAETPLYRKAVTPTLEQAFHVRKTFTGGQTDDTFTVSNPANSVTALSTADASTQYAIEVMTVSLSAAATLTLANASGGGGTASVIWGPHAFAAAGVYTVYFPRGLLVGDAKTIYYTNSAGNGTIELWGARVPVN